MQHMKNNRNKQGRNILRRAAAWVLAFMLLVSGFGGMESAQAASSGTVKVKLSRLGSPSAIELSVNCAYVLSGDVKMNIPSGSTLKLAASGGEITASINGVKAYCGSNAKLLRCGSGSDGIRFRSPSLANVFCGDLYLSASGSGITPVLHIYIEDYLYGVVAYEMSNSFPLEALKAQAVAARNYVMKKMSSRASNSYHVTDTSSDQVFKGYNSSYSRVIQAVQQTAGQALYAGGTLASCYYTASNGGQTESTKNRWGGSLSYSVVKDDPYDLENPSSKKTVAQIKKDASGLKSQLQEALVEGTRQELYNRGIMDASSVEILSINAIEPCNPRYSSPSRLYKTLRFDLSVRAEDKDTGLKVRKSVQVDVPSYGGLESWYGLSLNSSDSETVEVAESGSAFQIIFRRWGHGVGMSQRGAQTMASTYGKGHEFILNFYYPGTTLKTASMSRASSHGSVQVSGTPIARLKLENAAKLYSKADAGSAPLAQLSAGVEVNVYEANESWAAVSVLGLTGFVEAAVLNGLPESTVTPEPTAEPTIEPTIEPTATPEPTEEPTIEPTATSEPTAEPTIAPTIEPTATPQPTEEPTIAPTATPESLPEIELPEDEPAVDLPLIETVQPTQRPTATPVPQPTAVDLPRPTPAQGPDGTEGMLIATGTLYAYVRVSEGSTLTLRKAATTASSAVAYLKNGAQVQMIAFDDDWAYVRTTSGKSGFVARRYLYLPGSDESDQPVVQDTPIEAPDESASGESETGSSKKVFRGVQTDITFCSIDARTRSAAKLYKNYSTSSLVLKSMPESTRVHVMAYTKKWAYVSCGGRKGYMLLSTLRAE